jgi:hypothetical protein
MNDRLDKIMLILIKKFEKNSFESQLIICGSLRISAIRRPTNRIELQSHSSKNHEPNRGYPRFGSIRFDSNSFTPKFKNSCIHFHYKSIVRRSKNGITLKKKVVSLRK